MQNPLVIGTFLALPFIVYAVLQTVRGRMEMGFWGTILVYVALIAPVASLALNTLSDNPQPIVSVVALANAAIVLVVSILIFIIEYRKPERNLNHSSGLLGIGLGVLLVISVVTTPAIITAFNSAALPLLEQPVSASVLDDITGSNVINNTSTPNAPDTMDVASPLPPMTDNSAIQTVLDETGLTGAELQAKLDAGVSIAALVEDNGGDLDAVIMAITDAAREEMQLAVSDGAITQERANSVLEDVDNLVNQVVDGELSMEVFTFMFGDLLNPSGMDDMGASMVDNPVDDSTLPTLTATSTMDFASMVTRQPSATPTATHTPFVPPTTPTEVVESEELDTAHSCQIRVDYNLNMRIKPDMESEIVLTIPSGIMVTADERTKDWQWLHVGYNDKTGWVSRQYVYVDSCEDILVR